MGGWRRSSGSENGWWLEQVDYFWLLINFTLPKSVSLICFHLLLHFRYPHPIVTLGQSFNETILSDRVTSSGTQHSIFIASRDDKLGLKTINLGVKCNIKLSYFRLSLKVDLTKYRRRVRGQSQFSSIFNLIT